MVNQNKICSFKIKRQAKNVFPNDVEMTAVKFEEVTLHPFYAVSSEKATCAFV